MSSQNLETASPIPIDEGSLEKVRTGQRLIIYGILINLLAAGIRGAGEPIGALIVGIIALVLGITGLYRLAAGLQYSVMTRILLLIALFIPFVNIIVLVILSSRATKLLRSAGFTVGLLGAAPRIAA